jgi:hypothetical protein
MPAARVYVPRRDFYDRIIGKQRAQHLGTLFIDTDGIPAERRPYCMLRL